VVEPSTSQLVLSHSPGGSTVLLQSLFVTKLVVFGQKSAFYDLSRHSWLFLFSTHVFTTRCYAVRGYEFACRLSVMFRHRDHIGWNSSKIISRPYSLRLTRGLTPTWSISSNRNSPKLGLNSLCLCEIIPCVLLTYRVSVHWGVARVCPSVQRALAAPDCTPGMPIKSSNTRVRSHNYLYALCLLLPLGYRTLFTITHHYSPPTLFNMAAVKQRWRWIMMTAGITWLLVCVKYAIWVVVSSTCHFLADNLLQSVDKDQQETRAVTDKPHDAVVKFDTYRNVYSGIARSSLR